MLHTRFVSRAILGAISLSHTRLPACFPACPCLSVCLTSHVRPPACLCLCILPSAFPISPLLSIIIILSLLDFIVHTALDHCLAVRERDPQLPESTGHTISSCTGSLSARHPSASACGLPFRCWANRAPFYLLYPPRLVRHQVPVTGRASKHVTYPSSLFFSPLPLSSSLPPWICWHIDQTRETSSLAGICVLVVSFTAHHLTNAHLHTHPIHPPTAKQACLHYWPDHTLTWPPPTAIDLRPLLPV